MKKIEKEFFIKLKTNKTSTKNQIRFILKKNNDKIIN